MTAISVLGDRIKIAGHHHSDEWWLWPSLRHGDKVYCTRPYHPMGAGYDPFIAVPTWVYSGFLQTRRPEPLLDYLLENDLAPPALAEAIRAAYSPTGA
jgi:hypothetical protein